MGNVNQVGPTGSLTYGQTGSYTYTDPYTGKSYQLPQYTATTALNPTAQKAFNAGQGAQLNLSVLARDQSGFLRDYMSQGIDTSGLPGLRGSYAPRDGFSADRRRVEDAMMKRLRPQMEQERQSQEAAMANQGLALGSRAHSAASRDLGQRQNDQRTSVLLAGGQEQSRLLGEARSAAAFGNQARGQGMQEMFGLRNQPINEITALLSGGQVAMPNFGMNQPSTIPTTDVAGNIWGNYGAQAQQYQQQMAQWNNTMGGLFGLGAAGFGAL